MDTPNIAPFCAHCGMDMREKETYIVSPTYKRAFCSHVHLLDYQANVDKRIKEEKLKRLDGPDDDKYLSTEELGYDN